MIVALLALQNTCTVVSYVTTIIRLSLLLVTYCGAVTAMVECEQEIEKAWGMVDQAHTKENDAKETIQRLKQEINNLTKLVEQTAGVSMDKEHKYVTVRLVCDSNCNRNIVVCSLQ